MVPTIVRDKMVSKTSSAKGVLADFSMLILAKIGREPIIEDLIELHHLISGNAASVASNLRGGRNRHLILITTT